MTTKLDRIQVDYTVTFLTPFHCGTGIRTGLIDRTVTRDSGGYLYIPGSTFKGVLRERCEQLARYYEEDERYKQRIISPHNTKAVLQELNQTISMITRLFGSQYHPGRLFFDDIRQTAGDIKLYNSEDGQDIGVYNEIQVELYTQVRLDRPTRRAVDGALYTSEFGVREMSFAGGVSGGLECTAIDPEIADCFFIKDETNSVRDEENSPTYSLLLLLAGLHMVDRLGGNKSTGKGQCKCQVTQVKVNDKIYAQEEWEAWIGQLDALTYYYYSQEDLV